MSEESARQLCLWRQEILWQQIGKFRGDVQRIAEHGPCDTDKVLVRLMACVIESQLIIRQGEGLDDGPLGDNPQGDGKGA